MINIKKKKILGVRTRRKIILDDGSFINTFRTKYKFHKFLRELGIESDNTRALYNRKTKIYSQVTIEDYYSKRKKKFPVERFISDIRIRRQLVINYRSQSEPYYVSIRAMTQEPTFMNHHFINAIKFGMATAGFSINDFYTEDSYSAISEQKIDSHTDKFIDDGNMWIGIKIKKQKEVYYRYAF